jgi:very-short-patch-repair endonuclease
MGVKFRRQHLIGDFIADFACIEKRLLIEIDGGQHADELEQIADAKRSEFLRERGYSVIRFWNNEVLTDIDSVLTGSLGFFKGVAQMPLRVELYEHTLLL